MLVRKKSAKYKGKKNQNNGVINVGIILVEKMNR